MNKEKEKEKGAAPEQTNANQQDNISTPQEALQKVKKYKANIENIATSLAELTGQPKENIEEIFYNHIGNPDNFIQSIEAVNFLLEFTHGMFEELIPLADQVQEETQLDNRAKIVFPLIEKAFTSLTDNTDNSVAKSLSPTIEAVLRDYGEAYQTIATHLTGVDIYQGATFISEILKPYLDDPLTQPQPIADYVIEIIDAINTAAEVIDENSPHVEAIRAAREKAGIIGIGEIFNITNEKQPDKNCILSLDKLTTSLFNGISNENGEWHKIREGKHSSIDVTSEADKRKGKTALITVKLDFNELANDPNIRILGSLNSFDHNVLEAVCTYLDIGRKIISISEIHGVIAGTNRAPSSKKQIERIRNSLRKLRSRIIYINNAEERKLYKKQPFIEIDDTILSYKGVKVEYKGGISYGIKIHAKPPLLEYLEIRKRITKIPLSANNVGLSLTDENLMIRDYLQRRIMQMKNSKKYKKHILYDSIYKNCNITKDRKQRSRARDKIKTILDHFKKIGFITDYQKLEVVEDYNKKKERGIEIIL